MTDKLPSSKDKKSQVSKDEELLNQVEALPKDAKQKLTMSLSMYSGPIPHPDILKGYDSMYPGAAKKMIDNGLEESSHRRMLETKRQRRRGRLAYAVLATLIMFTMLFLYFSYSLLMNGHEIVGTIFGAGDFIVFIGTFTDMVDKLSSNSDLNSNSNNNDKDNSKN